MPKLRHSSSRAIVGGADVTTGSSYFTAPDRMTPTVRSVGDVMPSGCVYFIECGEYIKIGCTSRNDPYERMAEMMLPPNARIIAVIWGAGYPEETQLHRMFRDSRAGGEWFTRTPELDAVIKAHEDDGTNAPITWSRSGPSQRPTRGDLVERLR